MYKSIEGKHAFIENHWPLCKLILGKYWHYSYKIWRTPNGKLLCSLARESLGYSLKYCNQDLLTSMQKTYDEVLSHKNGNYAETLK